MGVDRDVLPFAPAGEGFTTICQGNLCDLRTRRDVTGTAGSVAGCESVELVMGARVFRSSTDDEEGAYVTSYEMGAW
jgi:hypothetical protein